MQKANKWKLVLSRNERRAVVVLETFRRFDLFALLESILEQSLDIFNCKQQTNKSTEIATIHFTLVSLKALVI